MNYCTGWLLQWSLTIKMQCAYISWSGPQKSRTNTKFLVEARKIIAWIWLPDFEELQLAPTANNWSISFILSLFQYAPCTNKTWSKHHSAIEPFQYWAGSVILAQNASWPEGTPTGSPRIHAQFPVVSLPNLVLQSPISSSQEKKKMMEKAWHVSELIWIFEYHFFHQQTNDFHWLPTSGPEVDVHRQSASRLASKRGGIFDWIIVLNSTIWARLNWIQVLQCQSGVCHHDF